MNRDNEFFEYLRTFLITLLFIFISIVILLFVIQHQVYEEQIHKQVEDETVDIYLIDVLIEKNKYLEQQSPLNYKINLKLGTLYEIKKDYKKAEAEYKQSIDKAPYNEFKPEYKLAILYLSINRFEDAESLMDSIDDEPDKILIKYKADIYEKLGDKYYNLGDYEDAIDKYEKALFYWNIIKEKREIKYIQDSLASSYVYLADTYVNNMQPQDAVSSLKMALSIVDAPILKYKLALLLMNDNPDLANRYFTEVFEKAPELINYETCSKFLSIMANNANAEGNTAQAQLYQYQQRKVNEYFKLNILSVDDIVLENVVGRIKPNNWFKKNNIYLEATLKNVSQSSIDSLFIEVIFKDKREIIEHYSEQIVDKKFPLKSGALSPLISIIISEPMKVQEEKPKIITAEIYASKTDKSVKLLLATVDIKERVKKKHLNKFLKGFLKEFGLFFDKITSKMPSFLF